MKKTIITVVGKDKVGVIAKICTYLSDHNVSIMDITQSIIDSYFNMMMIVNTENIDLDFAVFAHQLVALGDDLGVEVRCQRSDIFDNMHRI
ncbi:MAG TPA: ACT domain-containing protein [Rikenellaceae bacterium]|nr:ACT domain-containing protein [Rikenellaceae bacterium]HBH20560.1 ACT domain-containing protein [Rikenellaceae bacterium]HCZ22419.1 ACT domain-containing protein [Rikenellaceae bacterium]